MDLSSTILMILTAMVPTLILGSYPPSNCCPNKYPFLPAPPGHTPPCSKNGATFCEKIETYPIETIRYLLYKWGTMYSQFIKTELDQDFILMTQNYTQFYPKQNNNPNYGVSSNNYLYNSSVTYNKQQHQPSNTYLPQGTPIHYHHNHHSPPSSPQQLIPSADHPYQVHHPVAAIIPPILHSFWWNHHDRTTHRPAYPYLAQHRFHRYKRQNTGGGGGDNQLCRVSSRFTVPQAAMNNQGNWMYVVNMEGTRYTQQVRTEMCDGGDGSACDGLCSIPPGFRAACRQKYVQKRLVALEESGASLRGEVFWFPHCCVCEVGRGGS